MCYNRIEVIYVNRPNILLIMADQFRGDCLGIDGHPDVLTPNLDDLAAGGIRFTNAYSACPTCIPARAALYTGLSQEHHGRVGYEDGQPWRYAHTMAGELSRAGYQTQCVGKLHVHPLRNRVGFDAVELHDGFLHYYRKANLPYAQSQFVADDYYHFLRTQLGAERDITETGIDCNSWLSRPWPMEERFHPTNWVTDRSIDFLRRRDRDVPFFLMASYVRPHPPFDAPQCYFDLYRDRDLRAPASGDWDDEERLRAGGRFIASTSGPIDPKLVREAQIGYYACITQLDFQIGRLIMALIDDDLLDNTIVVFTSDHGELLCDHHLYRKTLPYQGAVRVPLIVRGLPGRQGETDPRVAELRDVMPTLLSLAGAELPPMDGLNLLGEETRAWLHGEHAGGGDDSNHYIVTQMDKYVWFSKSGREQYFHLATDPQEAHDRIADPACQARIADLRAHLIESLRGREEGYVQNERLVPGQKARNVLSTLPRE